MEKIRITEDNLESFEGLLPADIAECIGREYYQGIALQTDPGKDADAAMVWEIKNAEEKEKKAAELIWISCSEENGNLLFREYKNEAGDQEVRKTYFEIPGEKEPPEGLLREEGFSPEEKEGRNVMVSVAEFRGLKLADGKVPPYIVSLGELMVRQYRRGIINCLFQKRKGALEDLSFLPMNWFDPDISSCVLTDGNVTGFLLIHKQPSGVLEVDFLFAFEPDAQMNLVFMVRRSILEAAEKYPPETKVLLPRHNHSTFELVSRLFPGKKGMTVLSGERME